MTLIQVANLTIMLAVGLVALLVTHASSASSTSLDCFVADEPSADGPAAPSNVVTDVEFISFTDAEVNISWTDESSDETCFVIEHRFAGQITNPFEVLAIMPAGTTHFRDTGPYQQGDLWFFRVYAATATARSAYAEGDAYIPILEPTPTLPPQPSPSPSPQPSPTPVTTSETPQPLPPSATASTKLTPAAFPATGGSPFVGASSLGAAVGAFALLGAASLAGALAKRRGRH